MNITDHLELNPPHALGAQFDALARLQDGWLEGAGKAPPAAEIEWFSDQFVMSYPRDLPLPFVCPTPDGGLFLEWTLGPWIASAEVPLPGRRCELQATNTKTAAAVDAETSLADAAGFAALYAFVRRFL